MDWFEMSVKAPDDAKFQNLGARLKNPLAFGYVVRLYAHCYLHETDRFSGPGAVCAIERAADWRGKVGRLVANLLEPDVAILEREGEESLVVHGVGKRLASAIKRRDDAAARMERYRDRTRELRVTEREQNANGDAQRDAHVLGDPTGSDRTGPDLTGSDSSDRADTPGDASPFERWRREVSKRLGIIGQGGNGLGKPGGQRLGAAVRTVTEAIGRCGFELVVSACVDYAQGSGAKPEAVGFFLALLANLKPAASPRQGPTATERAIEAAQAECPDWARLLKHAAGLIRPDIVERWLAPLRAARSNGRLLLTAPDSFHASFVADQYADALAELAPAVFGEAIIVTVSGGAA